ncbi:methyl-accepting chemotaxis protein [Thalassobaculum litoreum]|uniref:Methyl-accepting chemotaxis protein n=1 Tax=Thalassobaculum litoreum DSM 18839 TaxID=1123362 RepID=A0A8G2BGC0_9PROT|nr:methyl-accepting chemotaxis protein [Thalassobaculum litoreum]SDF40785.1 methyl-accepting chemotaxis protein [Thalassobaculum litoreum DSM 18839]
MKHLSNLKISARLFSGFGIVLGLMVLLAATVSVNLLGTSQDVVDYRRTAVNTNQIGRIQANLLATRLAVKDFVKTGSDSAIAAVRERHAASMALFTEAEQSIKNSQRKAALAGMHAQMEQYGQTFEEVTALQVKRNELVAILNTIGPSATASLEATVDIVSGNGKPVQIAALVIAMEDLLAMRLEANKFLLDNRHQDLESAIAFKLAGKKNAEMLRGVVDDAVVDTLVRQLTAYENTLRSVGEVIEQRNTLITGTLDRIGPQVAEEIETMKLDYKSVQDTLGPQMQSDTENSVVVSIAVATVAVIVGVLAALLITRSIAGPVGGLTSAMGRLSDGDVATQIPSTEQKDEIGLMARAVQVFKDNMIRAQELEEQEKIQQAERNRRTEAVEMAVNDFQSQITERLEALRGVSDELGQSADTLTGVASETKEQSTGAAAASDQTAANVQSVSAAAEEMDSSFGEIVSQVSRASTSVENTSGRARQTLISIEDLQEQSEGIAQVIELITGIAEQTNLLALNATIEAARAGDAGKGFAVVASEVKSLATQTGKATEEISDKIRRVQEACGISVGAVRAIVTSIEEVNEISAAISAAVEQQKAATSEITRNMQEAAKGTEQLSSNIARVNEASDRTSSTVGGVTTAARRTEAEAVAMKDAIDGFIQRVKAA